ncbi:MAG: hypothetical protein ACE5OR_03490 [bacterium]
MRNVFTANIGVVLILFLIALMTLFMVQCEKRGTSVEQLLSGKAFLVGQNKHDGIKITNIQTSDITYTDSTGSYTLPMPEKDSTYTIVGYFPYCASDSVEIEIEQGKVLGNVPDLYLHQQLRVDIFTDKFVYHSEDTITISVRITNVSDDTIQGPISFSISETFFVLQDSNKTIYYGIGLPNPFIRYACDDLVAPGEPKIHQRDWLIRSYLNSDRDPPPPGEYTLHVGWSQCLFPAISPFVHEAEFVIFE